MKDLLLVVAAGLFSLGGVFLGALLMPLTQLYLERKREQRAADRAKLLVAGELLHAQLILRAASVSRDWPHVEDANAF
jgi:ABC-type branched-subunit amino acid transport system permease subunit